MMGNNGEQKITYEKQSRITVFDSEVSHLDTALEFLDKDSVAILDIDGTILSFRNMAFRAFCEKVPTRFLDKFKDRKVLQSVLNLLDIKTEANLLEHFKNIYYEVTNRTGRKPIIVTNRKHRAGSDIFATRKVSQLLNEAGFQKIYYGLDRQSPFSNKETDSWLGLINSIDESDASRIVFIADNLSVLTPFNFMLEFFTSKQPLCFFMPPVTGINEKRFLNTIGTRVKRQTKDISLITIDVAKHISAEIGYMFLGNPKILDNKGIAEPALVKPSLTELES